MHSSFYSNKKLAMKVFLSSKLLPVYADMEDLKSFSKEQGAIESNDLNHWDINFWSERLRESKYDINEVGFLFSKD